jgi:hypothetical protein
VATPPSTQLHADVVVVAISVADKDHLVVTAKAMAKDKVVIMVAKKAAAWASRWQEWWP